ncbi:MAG: acyltransferase [Chloroflexi bacterium]|nr:acyltransferase [Chloroflexota bacterium]
MAERLDRIPSLDGLRAVSIGFVVLSHLTRTQGFPLPLGLPESWLDNLGSLGVRVFFVISGFLISRLLFEELRATGAIRLSKFYFRRTLRIFLPYYFFVGAIFFLQATGWFHLTQRDLLHAITYTVDYYPQRGWDIGHAWSLSVEEQFYLLWPAIMLLMGKRRGLAIASIFVFLAPMVRLGYYYLFPQMVPWEVGYRFETVVDALAIGCLLAGAFEWLRGQTAYRKVIGSRFFLAVPAAVLLVTTMDPRLRGYLFVGVAVQNLGIAACLSWCMTNYGGKTGRVLNSRPLVFLGRMSYSTYLWQQPFLNFSSSLAVASFPLNLLLVGTTSLAAHLLVERPSLAMRRWLECRVFTGSSTPEAATEVDGKHASVALTRRVPFGYLKRFKGSKAHEQQ